MKFIQDIFTEDKKDNKYSSKKTLGIISGVLVCIAFIGDGFHWFTINEDLFNSMLIYISYKVESQDCCQSKSPNQYH